MNLFNNAWEQGGTKWCVQGFQSTCRWAPCTATHEVDCCERCEFVKKGCHQPCEAFRRKK